MPKIKSDQQMLIEGKDFGNQDFIIVILDR